MTNPIKIAAIYTTFKPDSGFRERINSVIQSCTITIVVDNTPGGHDFQKEDLIDLILLQDGTNKGLGAALNIGIIEAKRQHCDAVILFDQDSSPSSYFIFNLIHGLNNSGPRTIIGPLLVDDKKDKIIAINPNNKLTFSEELNCIPTSGMSFFLNELEDDDLFTEDFFIDFVDFDWCWRLKNKGWRILRILSLPMPHRLGICQRNFLGFTYHVPTPVRHYFQFRDGLKILTMRHVPTYSRIRFSIILIPKLLIYPFLLDNGIERLKWMIFGIKDAILNRSGIGAGNQVLQRPGSPYSKAIKD